MSLEKSSQWNWEEFFSRLILYFVSFVYVLFSVSIGV